MSGNRGEWSGVVVAQRDCARTTAAILIASTPPFFHEVRALHSPPAGPGMLTL